MIYLREAEIRKTEKTGFPFNLTLIKEIKNITFDRRVTIFVGDNGSGKSTLLEGLAAAVNLPVAGGEEVAYDDTLAPARALGQTMRLKWNRRTSKGFYLRSEDFFNFSKRINKIKAELRERLKEVEIEYADKSRFSRAQARMAYTGEIAAFTSRYGEDLDANSHGESFMLFFQQRLVPEGLYLLDEPETPLSPLRQLSLLSVIMEMAEENDCQFIIATHSPMLMSCPDARVYSFDTIPPKPMLWKDIEQVNLMRDFLNAPDRFIRHLR